MIDIYRCDYDSPINFFHGRGFVRSSEIVLKEKGTYKYVEPKKPGRYAFGGTILYTSNGVFPEFTIPIKLHDRQMDLEISDKQMSELNKFRKGAKLDS